MPFNLFELATTHRLEMRPSALRSAASPNFGGRRPIRESNSQSIEGHPFRLRTLTLIPSTVGDGSNIGGEQLLQSLRCPLSVRSRRRHASALVRVHRSSRPMVNVRTLPTVRSSALATSPAA